MSCDPLTTNCPVENPTGPSFEDVPVKMEEDLSGELLIANLQLTGAMLSTVIYLGFTG